MKWLYGVLFVLAVLAVGGVDTDAAGSYTLGLIVLVCFVVAYVGHVYSVVLKSNKRRK